MTDKPENKDMIRKIWLAGIGASGRALTEAKGAVDGLSGKSSAAFDALVQKGEMLEAVGKYKAEELLGKGKSVVPDLDLDDRISRMRARLSGGADGGDTRLAARVDAMEAKLDAILAKLDIGDVAKGASKTKAKTSTGKIPKPASKKKMTTERTEKPIGKTPSPSRKTAPNKTAPKKSDKA